MMPAASYIPPLSTAPVLDISTCTAASSGHMMMTSGGACMYQNYGGYDNRGRYQACDCSLYGGDQRLWSST